MTQEQRIFRQLLKDLAIAAESTEHETGEFWARVRWIITKARTEIENEGKLYYLGEGVGKY